MAKPIRSLWSDQAGNAAIIFAVVAFPTLGLLGMGIDYTRSASLRTRLQAAVDAAVLNYAHQASGVSQAAPQSAIQNQVAAAFKASEFQSLSVSASATSSTLQASATMVVPRIMGLLGSPSLTIGSSSTATWGTQSLEVALVIDNSQSMSESFNGTTKMAAVKTAAVNLVSSLFASGASSVKVAVVPFDTDVNVGTGNLSASWIDDSNVSSGGYGYSSYGGGSSCGWGSYCSPNWAGCIWDRTQNYDVQNVAPSSTSTKYQPDPNRTSSCDLTPFLKLATSQTTVNATLNDMSPAGNTNLTIGLAWGFNMLTPNAPFSGPAALGSAGVYKSLVFMTDGQNTKNRWSTTQSQIDARTTLACNNIKAAGIEVYTIGTVDANAAQLQACASDPSLYYSVTSGSEMNAAFTDIAAKISRLRLSR
jgi:Flp pilus assembly protein TadG